MQDVDYFLNCINRDLGSSLPTNDRDVVRNHAQDVIAQLTHRLLELFKQNQVRTNIEPTYLDDVMRTLRDLDDTRLEECIPDGLVPEILVLMETLTTAEDYYNDSWVGSIQRCARALKDNIDRVKSKRDAT